MKPENYYKYNIKGLTHILNDGLKEGKTTIHKTYLLEKLNRILSGIGIGFTPSLKLYLDEEFGKEETWKTPKVTDLLSNIGSKGECKGCYAVVWWVKHSNGKNVPYTSLGLNHFIDCPEADKFRKKQK